MLLAGAADVRATIRYVNQAGTNPVSPYTSWATAATNIQDAVNLASFNDTVLVTNGIYQYGGATHGGSSNRVVIAGTLVQSVNGPAVTIIKGYQVPGTTNGTSAVRCAYLSEFGKLYGFTLTGGATLTSSSGGALLNGGGAVEESSCIVSNCIITGNTSYGNGGGSCSFNNALLINCVISGNTAFNGGSGGGAYGNSLVSCIVSNNLAVAGGGMGGSSFNSANNCLFIGNGSTNSVGGTAGGAAAFCALNNCTVAGNFSHTLGALQACTVSNSIIYNNNNSGYADCYQCQLIYSCTPLGLGTSTLLNHSISNAPGFLDPGAGNYRLQLGSPCIDAGTNNLAPAATDLDGNARIVGAMVDMGAYENQNTNAVHYVNLSNTVPVAPFTNWVSAATNIQDAIDSAAAGDFIVVSNGVYNYGGRVVFGATTNRVVVDRAVTVQSLNGPGVTAIVGFNGMPTSGFFVRGVYLTNGAVLAGFSISNGASRFSGGDLTNEQSGGGIWCESALATITNCVLTRNYAQEFGGGAYQGTFLNCAISNNTAFISGGGSYNAMLNNCIVSSNRLIQGSGGGGGGAGSAEQLPADAELSTGQRRRSLAVDLELLRGQQQCGG